MPRFTPSHYPCIMYMFLYRREWSIWSSSIPSTNTTNQATILRFLGDSFGKVLLLTYPWLLTLDCFVTSALVGCYWSETWLGKHDWLITSLRTEYFPTKLCQLSTGWNASSSWTIMLAPSVFQCPKKKSRLVKGNLVEKRESYGELRQVNMTIKMGNPILRSMVAMAVLRGRKAP